MSWRKLRAVLKELTDPGVPTTAWPGDWRDLELLQHGPPVVWIPVSFLARHYAPSDALRFLGFRWGDFGYLPVYRGRTVRAWRAVWPLPLWALHIIGHAVWLATWGLVAWLERRGLVHFDAAENELLRLRDVRLGRRP